MAATHQDQHIPSRLARLRLWLARTWPVRQLPETVAVLILALVGSLVLRAVYDPSWRFKFVDFQILAAAFTTVSAGLFAYAAARHSVREQRRQAEDAADKAQLDLLLGLWHAASALIARTESALKMLGETPSIKPDAGNDIIRAAVVLPPALTRAIDEMTLLPTPEIAKRVTNLDLLLVSAAQLRRWSVPYAGESGSGPHEVLALVNGEADKLVDLLLPFVADRMSFIGTDTDNVATDATDS